MCNRHASKLVLLLVALSFVPGCQESKFLGYLQVIYSVSESPDSDRLAFLYNNGSNKVFTVKKDGTDLKEVVALGRATNDVASEVPFQTVTIIDQSLCQTILTNVFIPLDNNEPFHIVWSASERIELSLENTLLAINNNGAKLWAIRPKDLIRDCIQSSEEPSRTPLIARFDVSAQTKAIALPDGVIIDGQARMTHVLWERVRDAQLYLRSPAWSPDGKQVAYIGGSSSQDPEAKIYIFNLEANKVSRLAFPEQWKPSTLAGLVWHESQERLSCLAWNDVSSISDGNIATFDLDGSDFQISKHPGVSYLCSSTAPNTLLAIRPSNGIGAGFGVHSIIEINLATSAERTLIDTEALPKDVAIYAR